MRTTVTKLNAEHCFQLSKNQTLTICAGEINISCISGILWITWAGGREQCLTHGESLAVQSHIKICIQAFAVSHIRLLRTQTRFLGIQHRNLRRFALDRLRQMEYDVLIKRRYPIFP